MESSPSMYRTDTVRIHSILSSNKTLLFDKKHEKLTFKIYKLMKTIPTKQTNEKQITIHQSELGEETYPFAILEESEVNEEGQSVSIFEPILGNNRFSEVNFKTKEETIDYIKSKPYDLILALICHCVEMKDNFEKEQQQLKKSKKK